MPKRDRRNRRGRPARSSSPTKDPDDEGPRPLRGNRAPRRDAAAARSSGVECHQRFATATTTVDSFRENLKAVDSPDGRAMFAITNRHTRERKRFVEVVPRLLETSCR